MIKIFISAIVVLLVGCGGASDNQNRGTITKSIFKLNISDGVIYYKGEISNENYQIFQDTVGIFPAGTLSKIIINSGGGDTVFGRKIGKFVFDNQLDVEVEELCFSSCANYIFTAGVNKIIQKDAFVGWHGNEHQSFILASIANQTPSKHLKDELRKVIKEATKDQDMSEEAFNSIVEKIYQQRITSIQDEKSFFEDIGVNKFVALLGLKEQLSKNYGGFTYSLKDMETFNVRNVTYQGNGVYPQKIPKQMFVYKIKETDADVIQTVFNIDDL